MLVNLSATKTRTMVVQGGAHAEHRILRVQRANGESLAVDGAALAVSLPPGTGERLRIEMRCYANTPTCRFPFPVKHPAQQNGLTLYVAPSGNDTWSGRLAANNQEAIRKLKTAGGLPAGGLTVEVIGGTYDLTRPLTLGKDDSGTAEAPITYRARPGANSSLPATGVWGALLISVAVRSLGGLIVGWVHRDAAGVLWGLAIAAFAGKAAGGVVADRWGWVKVSVLALLLSAPLLSFVVGKAPLAVSGMLLFQMTMPVTLLAVYRVFPGEWFAGPLAILVLILSGVAALLIGLPPVLRTVDQQKEEMVNDD